MKGGYTLIRYGITHDSCEYTLLQKCIYSEYRDEGKKCQIINFQMHLMRGKRVTDAFYSINKFLLRI